MKDHTGMRALYKLFSWGSLVVILLLSNGCLTLSHSLPPVNLEQPGWTVHQGQAVWKLPSGKNDIAGDVLVGNGPGNQSFVQFTKSPFPLVIGQISSNRWQLEFPAQARRYSGFGSPPRRAMWLYLPAVMAGQPPPRGWAWKNSGGNWRLENHRTGETIEGFFAQ
jgi:hypothetical protein